MLKKPALAVTLTAAVLFAMPTIAEQPTNTVLRALFCFGVLEYAVEQEGKSPPPMYLTPDGRGYTPPNVARRLQENTSNALRQLWGERERLRRFLLPFYLDNELLLPLAAARNDGKITSRACDNVRNPSDQACARLRRCFPLDWLPY